MYRKPHRTLGAIQKRKPPGAIHSSRNRRWKRPWRKKIRKPQSVPIRRRLRKREGPSQNRLQDRMQTYPQSLSYLPANLSAAAIVSVRNEEETIARVVNELKRLHRLLEIIVIVNGSTDQTYERVRAIPGITVVHYPEPLGHDVGRAVGAKLAKSEILLFVDGDFPIAAEALVPFLLAIYDGADVALNDISPYLGIFRSWDAVSRAKAFLNCSLGRPELRVNSLTSIPHALSRRAIDKIGALLLMVPPVAQAAAIAQGLRFALPTSVNVITSNRIRRTNTGADNKMARLIMGDHIEALRRQMTGSGSRLRWTDAIRTRSAAEGGAT